MSASECNLSAIMLGREQRCSDLSSAKDAIIQYSVRITSRGTNNIAQTKPSRPASSQETWPDTMDSMIIGGEVSTPHNWCACSQLGEVTIHLRGALREMGLRYRP